MGEVAEVKKEDIFKRETKVSNPWSDPNFNKIDDLGGEPGFKVDDIPERLGLVQRGFNPSSPSYYFTDLEDTPSNYGKKEQFVKTDGDGKLTFDWPYWVKAGSTIYYKRGKVAVGLSAPLVQFHTYGDNILDGAVTINESGRDKDFRVEGDTEANLLFCDASTDRVAVGLNAPYCRTHIRGVVCAAYAGLHPDTILFIENDDNVYIQLQGAADSNAGIIFADGDYNPPAGMVRYDFADEQIEFGIGTNELVLFKSNHGVFSYGYIHLDSPDTYAVFVADSHNADSYVEYKEDGSTKWTAGFDYTDSLKFQISEGIPGTNVRFEIEPGVSGLINLYQDVGIRNSQDLRFYDNGNYVGFKAPGLAADQIWFLPNADGPVGSPLVTDGAGTLGFAVVTKQIYLNNAAFTKGTTAPTQVILGNLNAWEFDIGDDVVMTIMLPFDWATGTDITIKVCWYIDEAYVADKEIQWRVDWSALPHNFSEAVDAPTHSGQIDSGNINIPAIAKRMGLSTIGTIVAANLSAHDMLGFTLSRIAVTNDNPTADPAIHHLIIEYTADKLGIAT